jgi:geranylgeranyl transferase type-2 subunit alpha
MQAPRRVCAQVDAIRNGTALILQCRQHKRYDEAVMVAAAKLLKVVPEVSACAPMANFAGCTSIHCNCDIAVLLRQIYTIWNFRREALEGVLAAGGDAARAACATELSLTQACLQENPKSYAAWFHRKWVVSFGLADMAAELALVSRCVARSLSIC